MCHANVEESIKKNSILKNSNRRVSVPLKVNSVQSLSHVWLFVSHGLQHARLPCPSPTPRAYSNSCPLSRWCHPTISSSDTLFSFCPQSFLASGTFPMSQLFVSNDQNTGASASASVLPMSIQGWFPSRLIALISLLSKKLSGVFSSTTVQRYQFFGTLSSLCPVLTTILDH